MIHPAVPPAVTLSKELWCCPALAFMPLPWPLSPSRIGLWALVLSAQSCTMPYTPRLVGHLPSDPRVSSSHQDTTTGVPPTCDMSLSLLHTLARIRVCPHIRMYPKAPAK